MKDSYNTDYLNDYDTAITALKTDPNNPELKHQAVLALARAGSLEFALKEYQRYALEKIRHHEDIMALGGRLYKDLYLQNSGKEALEYAQKSAAKYEAAFQDTQGYYSGINSAAMALISDMPWDIVKTRVENILTLLPPTENLSPENHYFVEATRAECLLILGQSSEAKNALRKAITFDPLNYTAHASTLKQFKLILDKRGAENSWIDAFKPPRPAHFAGHLWSQNDTAKSHLSTQLSDAIQHNDIGFGYGALAAGADIIIAETLLTEGAELNIFLPVDIDSFIDHSVRPFGDGWISRFKDCINQAQTLSCLPTVKGETNVKQTVLAGHMAMGQSIIRSQQLGVSALQLLIHDPARSKSLTTHHKTDWVSTGRKVVEVLVSPDIQLRPERSIKIETMDMLLGRSGSDKIEKHKTFESVIRAMSESQTDTYGIHFDLKGSPEELRTIMQNNHTGGILVSEPIAGFLALKYQNLYNVIFAGIVAHDTGPNIRCYTVRANT